MLLGAEVFVMHHDSNQRHMACPCCHEIMCVWPKAQPAVSQEDRMGRDKLDVAKLLQRHNVIVKGGAEDGRKLLDALVVSPPGMAEAPPCWNALLSCPKCLYYQTGWLEHCIVLHGWPE